MKYDVIIIGAGAAGLYAMKELVSAGYKVCMLEAAETPGGRVATIEEHGFTGPVETGAEFIHGKLPVTFKLLKEAGVSYEAVEGDMIGVQNGEWKHEEHDNHWDKFLNELNNLRTDITILQFLDTHFSDPEYVHLREAVQRFAQGFDLADISKASILPLRNEWKNIDKKQYRVKGGYMQLLNYLLKFSLQKNAVIYLNACVNKIEYDTGVVIVTTTEKKTFESDKLIITVSLGVLQSGSIEFKPGLKDHGVAIQGIGFGSVIKILLEFKTSFWKEFEDDIGFILSNEEIPTWWTQLPRENNLLTGWLGGPKAVEKVFEPEETLLQTALQSLSNIFRIPPAMLREELVHHKIICWQKNQFIKGGYSYSTLASEHARKVLSTPINDTIFFAGEAIVGGDSTGTVESALQSGKDTAALLMKKFHPEQQS
jgi:monoamine oxidase